jgi:PAS domain S-box-containing protein
MGKTHQAARTPAKLGFFEKLASPSQLLDLLNHLPASYFFAKDLEGRFVHVNQALIEVLGLKSESEVIGKTDHDLFPREVANQYRKEDKIVIQSGRALNEHVCAVPDSSGILRWYVETKIPLLDADGKTIGVAGIMYDLEKAGAMLEPYERLNAAITHITNHYSEKITVECLAKLSHLSISQFKRVFKQLFRTTPNLYLRRVRINAACVLLRETAHSIEAISQQTGHYDASHFARQFRSQMHVSPGEFREQNRGSLQEP